MSMSDPQTVLDAIQNARRSLVIVGTVPITHPEVWRSLTQSLFPKLDESDLRIHIIAESDNQLFQHSLRTDTSYANPEGRRLPFTQLKFRREMLEKELLRTPNRTKHSKFAMSTLPLPLYLVKVDDESTWYLPVTGYVETLERFRKLTAGDPWLEMVTTYLSKLLDTDRDGRYLAASDTELLELFDQNHIPRGIYPRDCFYNTDHYQYVVWDFVFSRRGELLIHQRKTNAKDNQGMWDKSVGGHIDYNKERSSADAAVRELIEELYVKEKDRQTGHEFSLLGEDLSKVLFLGDWRPGKLGPDYLTPVMLVEKTSKDNEEPWVFYRVPGTIEHNTPRILPDNQGERKLRVLADIFVFIANTVLTPEYAQKVLKNSRYRLIEPDRLKSWIDNEKDDESEPFLATPDLRYVMTGKLRELLQEVAQLIEYSGLRR